MTALGVSAVLAVLAVLCLSLVSWRNAAQAREREAVKAAWNARSGREHYLASGQLTADLSLDPHDSTQRCLATRQPDGALVFEGISGKTHRKLICEAGDPSRVREP
jgi:hypothetical protein